ncbi:MAG: polymer-forming cytoskeletal protein, partial [Gemmatimonadota bacterium]
MTRGSWKSVVAYLLGAGLVTAPAGAQEVVLRGEGDIRTDAWLESMLDEGGYRLITTDTLIVEGDTLPGPVLVLGATLRVSGVVLGDLWSVRGNLFLRPGGVVSGEVRNIAGGFYPSELAVVRGDLLNDPNAPYRLETSPGTYRIVGTLSPFRVVLPGVMGLRIPTYNRVEGVGLRWGPDIGFPRVGLVKPWLRAWAGWRTGPGNPIGGAELALERARTIVMAGVERDTRTPDAWIRGEPMNSLTFAWSGKDRRFYYDAERAWVGAERVLERHARTTTARLRLQAEDASTMGAGSPWTLFGDVRPDSNVVIDVERITSLVLEAESSWELPTWAVELTGLVEVAREELDGEADFARWVLHGAVAVPGLANHTLEVEARAQAPFPGTETLPRQRWSFLGDSPVLYTFELAQFPGDRLAFVKTEYTVPLPGPRLPFFLGTPKLQFLHTVGKAWSAEVDHGVHQNVGASVRFNWARLRVVTNPEDLGAAEVSVGVFVPGGGYPWEREG